MDTEAVTGGPGQSGGSVRDVAPVVRAFTGSLDTAENSGQAVETFTVTLFDANGERDFRNAVVTITLTGVATGTFTRTLTAAEAAVPTEPAAFGADGFKAWSGTANDGVVHVKLRYAIPVSTPAGAITITPSVTPAGGSAVTGPADATTITLFSEITIGPTPVLLDGTPAATPRWGGWSSTPGATQVESATFVKLANTGQKPDASVVIDFSEAAFTGEDANFSIPIDGNVQFAWCETPASGKPSDCAFTWSAVSAGGSATVSFTGLGNVVFVKYRVMALPDVLAAQAYGATFTATEL